MSGLKHASRTLLAAAVLVAVVALHTTAQEKPLNLSGVLSIGFYSTRNQNGFDTRVSSVPTSLELNLSGFVARPDFLRFEVRPQISTGAQASEAGFLNGDGLSLSTTFLSRRSFPLTIRYSNLRFEQVTYGSLTRISGLRSLSHDRQFGLDWQLRLPGLPQLSFSLGRSQNRLEPDAPIIPDSRFRGRHYTLNLNDRRWGWTLDGKVRWETFSSQFANPLQPDFRTAELDQRLSQYEFNAQRRLWRGSQLMLGAGVLNNRTTFNQRPYDQDARYLNAIVTFDVGKRWQGNLRAGYTSNLLGAQIQESLRDLAGSGGSTPAAAVLIPFETRVTNRTLSGNVRYQVHRDWNLLGGVNHNNVGTPDGIIASADSNSLSGTAGISYNHRYSWATLTSQYTLNVGRFDYAQISDSRILGHSFSLVAVRGTVDDLELTGSFNLATQRVDQLTALRNSFRSAELSLGRRISRLVFRGAVGMQQSTFKDGGFDYQGDGLLLRAGVEHSRLQFYYSRNLMGGDTLQPILAGLANGAPGRALLPRSQLRLIVSSFRTQMVSFRASPWRRLETNLNWTKGRQEFDNQVNTDFEQLDFRVGYRFRLLVFDVGYTRYEQSFLTLGQYMRNRFYFRVSRPFRIL